MNKFKRKPVAQSPAAIGRQMAADAQRMRKKIEKKKLVSFDVEWLGASATAATTSAVEPDARRSPKCLYAVVDDVIKLDEKGYERLAGIADWLPVCATSGSNDTHTLRLRSLAFGSTVA